MDTEKSTRSTHHQKGRMDMYLIGENLAHSIIGLEEIGQSSPVVLVGHCIGGIVPKQVCLQSEEMGAKGRVPGSSPHKTFLENIKGTFFYSTPNSGSSMGTTSKQRGPLLQYLDLLSKDAARLSSSFAKLRQRHGWKTFGVLEASETEDCRSIVRTPHPVRANKILYCKSPCILPFSNIPSLHREMRIHLILSTTDASPTMNQIRLFCGY